MQTKIINIQGEDNEVHTLVATRIEVQDLNSSELTLIEETGEIRPVVSVMNIIGGPYVGTQWDSLHNQCHEELRPVYAYLQSREGWDTVHSGSRIDLQGNIAPKPS